MEPVKILLQKKKIIEEILLAYPPPKDKRVKYGTSGIRDHFEYLHGAMLRCALFLVFKSYHSMCKAVGFVITGPLKLISSQFF